MKPNTETALAIQPKLTVILNGGSSILESARIPIQFGVNDALAEIQPTHILVIIQHESEVGTVTCGTRKLIPLSRASDFICFDSAGKHTVTFIALKGDMTASQMEELVRPFLRENKPGVFREFIDLHAEKNEHRIEFEDRQLTSCVVSVFSKDVSVPKDLFAPATRTWVWEWANVWHRYQPSDECSYRSRLIYAFTLKPILWFTSMIVLKYLWATCASAWMIGAKLTCLFMGWRPEPIFKDFDVIWGWGWNTKHIDWDIGRRLGYGVWENDGEKYIYYPITGSAILMIPAFIAIFMLSLILVVEKWKESGTSIACIVFGIIIILTAVGLVTSWTRLNWWQRTATWLLGRWRIESVTLNAIRMEKQRPLYFEWLKTVLNADRLPSKVNLDGLPMAFKGSRVHKFRLSINAMKAKVCRPFSRR